MPELMTAPEAAPSSMEERLAIAESQRYGGDPEPDPTPDVAPPAKDTPAPDDAPVDATEPPEPDATAPAEAAEGDTTAQGDVTLTAQQAQGIMAMLEAMQGTAPAATATDNVVAFAPPQGEATAPAEAPVAWQPMSDEEAFALGMDETAREVMTQRERALAQTVLREFKPIYDDLVEAVNEATDRSEIATATHFLLNEHPELEQMIPQVRNAIKQARVADPKAAPSKIRAAAYAACAPHLAGLEALQRIRGVQKVDSAKPASAAPGTARPNAQTNRPLNMQERLQAAADRLGIPL